MKLIKNSSELIDMETIGLKSFQYCYNSSDSGLSSNNNQQQGFSSSSSTASLSVLNEINIEYSSDLLDLIINQNGITYEQLQNIIDELLVENNYHLEDLKYLREELPSLD